MNRPQAIIYTRVSTEEQAEHGTSLAGQLEAGHRVASLQNADVVAHYQDAGVSGAHYATREGLQRALADLETGRANMLIVYDVTRLSRDVEHLSAIVKRVRNASAQLVFHSGRFEDTPEGEMLLGINGIMSQFERSKIRERSMNGKLRRLGEGKQPCVGMRPYGYFVVSRADVYAGKFPPGTESTYIVDENERPWAVAIFQRYAAGASLREVARWLQDNGVPSPAQAPDRLAKYKVPPRNLWHPVTILNILKNPVYKGQASYGKRKHITDEGRLQAGYKRKDFCQRVSTDKWQYVSGQVPALVDEATWEACQARLATNQNSRSGNPETRYLFTGQLRCPVCGRGLYGSRRTRPNEATYISYHCRDHAKAQRADKVICNPSHYNERHLLSTLIYGLTHCAPLLEAAITAEELRYRAKGNSAQVERLKAELVTLDKKERATVEAELAALSSGRSAEVYRNVLTELDTTRRNVRTQLGELEARQQDVVKETPKARADIIASAILKLEAVLSAEEITVAEKNGLLRHVIDIIVPHEDRVEVTLKPRKEGGTVIRIVTLLS